MSSLRFLASRLLTSLVSSASANTFLASVCSLCIVTRHVVTTPDAKSGCFCLKNDRTAHVNRNTACGNEAEIPIQSISA
ncbi:hypothetical protein V8C43DRAFT_281249 [Trichoderma afarasin]